MGEPVYPPPPPPAPPSAFGEGGPHGPRTNLFMPVRRRLEALELPPLFENSQEPKRGLLVGFLISAVFGSIAYPILDGLGPYLGFAATEVLITPLINETFKALCMLFAAAFLWRVVPNRRYGAALGAVVGLGFSIPFQIVYIAINQPAPLYVAIYLVLYPIMDVISSAIIGLGLFVLIAKRERSRSFLGALFGLPLFFYCLAVVSWLVWLALDYAIKGGLAYIVEIVFVIPTFAFFLRDFLGGHFNFQNFLEPLPEPGPSSLLEGPPLPPPQSES